MRSNCPQKWSTNWWPMSASEDTFILEVWRPRESWSSHATLPTQRAGQALVHVSNPGPTGSLFHAPSGIRIRVATLKGWCPSPLDDGGTSPL